MDAESIIKHLGLQPHPEGGHYKEIYSNPEGFNGRPYCTSIYFLLKAGETSHWHKVDAAEVWAYHAGASLALEVAVTGGPNKLIWLGSDLLEGQQPQAIVPANAWCSAKSLGDWTLVGCIVAPGFQFSGFELAAVGWWPNE